MKTKPTLWVLPLKKVVRDPKTLAILSRKRPTKVPDASYWNRRIRCGDCKRVEVDTSGKVAETAATPKKSIRKPVLRADEE